MKQTIIIVCFLMLNLITLQNATAFELYSPAFMNGSVIPKKFTCNGQDISPQLDWANPPTNTKSYVLILKDPDAPHGTWYHWLLFNIPYGVYELKEGTTVLPQGTEIGINSWDRQQYGGPCPPSGVHEYIFTLYALDTNLALTPGISESVLKTQMQGHVLANAKLEAAYP